MGIRLSKNKEQIEINIRLKSYWRVQKLLAKSKTIQSITKLRKNVIPRKYTKFLKSYTLFTINFGAINFGDNIFGGINFG